MKTRNLKLAVATLCIFTGAVMAQDNPSEGLETTTSKTYKVDMGDKTVSRTVEISTKRSTDVMTKESDAGQIDQDRDLDSTATITKTVRIDNDDDDAFDEKIVFTYNSNSPEDFVLISNKEELTVAIDSGKNLKIVEDMTLKSKNKSDKSSTYIFTNKNGKDIEFLVEEYSKGNKNASGSK